MVSSKFILSWSIAPLLVQTCTAAAVRSSKLQGNRQASMLVYANTIQDCSLWYDNDASLPCGVVPLVSSITKEEFLAWNPSIEKDCRNFKQGYSYCVAIKPAHHHLKRKVDGN